MVIVFSQSSQQHNGTKQTNTQQVFKYRTEDTNNQINTVDQVSKVSKAD